MENIQKQTGNFLINRKSLSKMNSNGNSNGNKAVAISNQRTKLIPGSRGKSDAQE